MDAHRSLSAQHDHVVVAPMPAEIDIANAKAVSLALLAALPAARVVVADMTGTKFCDCSGVRAILYAREQVEACGAELRLAMSTPLVRRVFKITEADQLVGIYPDVAAAARKPPAARNQGRVSWARMEFAPSDGPVNDPGQ